MCSNCHTGACSLEMLSRPRECNPCNLHRLKHTEPRPVDPDTIAHIRRRKRVRPIPDEGAVVGEGRVCSNCHTTQSCYWRRSQAGERECNACYMHLRRHGEPRVVEGRSDSSSDGDVAVGQVLRP